MHLQIAATHLDGQRIPIHIIILPLLQHCQQLLPPLLSVPRAAAVLAAAHAAMQAQRGETEHLLGRKGVCLMVRCVQEARVETPAALQQ